MTMYGIVQRFQQRFTSSLSLRCMGVRLYANKPVAPTTFLKVNLWRNGRFVGAQETKVFVEEGDDMGDVKLWVKYAFDKPLKDVPSEELKIYYGLHASNFSLEHFKNGEFGQALHDDEKVPPGMSEPSSPPIMVVAPDNDEFIPRHLNPKAVELILDIMVRNLIREHVPASHHPVGLDLLETTFDREDSVHMVEEYVRANHKDWHDSKALAVTYAAPGCGKTHFLSSVCGRLDSQYNAVYVGFNSQTSLQEFCNVHEKARGGVVPTVVRILWSFFGQPAKIDFSDFAQRFYWYLGKDHVSLKAALDTVEAILNLKPKVLLLNDMEKLDDTALQEILTEYKSLPYQYYGFSVIVSTSKGPKVLNVATNSNLEVNWVPLVPLEDTSTTHYFCQKADVGSNDDRKRIVRYLLALCSGHPRTLFHCAAVLPYKSSEWYDFSFKQGLAELERKMGHLGIVLSSEHDQSILFFVAASMMNVSVPIDKKVHGLSLADLVSTGFAINAALGHRSFVPSSTGTRSRSDGGSYEMFHSRFNVLRRWAFRTVFPNQDDCSLRLWYRGGSFLKRGNVDKLHIPQLISFETLFELPEMRADLPNEGFANDFVLTTDQARFVTYDTNNGNCHIFEEVKYDADAATQVGSQFGKDFHQFNSPEAVWVHFDPQNNKELKSEASLIEKMDAEGFKGTVILMSGCAAKEWYGPTFCRLASFWMKSTEPKCLEYRTL